MCMRHVQLVLRSMSFSNCEPCCPIVVRRAAPRNHSITWEDRGRLRQRSTTMDAIDLTRLKKGEVDLGVRRTPLTADLHHGRGV